MRATVTLVMLSLSTACGSAEPAPSAPTPEAEVEAQPEPAAGAACEEGHECLCDGCAGTSRVALCEDGACVVVDLTVHPLAACAEDAECVVIRRDCCACEEGHVAVRAGNERDYYAATCGETPICSPCEQHDIPPELAGRCVEGRCEVATVELPPPHCPPGCTGYEDGQRCEGEPCTCAAVHQPFADCEPRPARPCPSARAFLVACDPRCCE